MAARDQVRRVQDSCPAGQWRGPAVDRTGLDWTRKYPAIAAAFASFPARQAYLDGELCGVRFDGTTSFSLIQNASDTGNAEPLVFFLFDLLHLDGETITARPLWERKERLHDMLSHANPPLQFSDHQIGHGRAFYEHACDLKLEGIVSKRADAPYAPGNRGQQKLSNGVKAASAASLRIWREQMLPSVKQHFIRQVQDMIFLMPKKDLAAFAEEMIDLTAVKRKF